MGDEFGSAKSNLAAALLLCMCFGSIHAFGVLVAPLEQVLHTSRAAASLGYSVATAALTAGVFLGPRLGTLLSLRQRILWACFVSALGVALAAAFPSELTLIIGYGVMFGIANGVAYGLSLELASAAMPQKPATGIGLATAIYGMGAVAFSFLLDTAIQWHGVQAALFFLAATLLCCCALAALPLHLRTAERVEDLPKPDVAASRTWALWVYFLLMTASGLMVIAHAPAIVETATGTSQKASLAAMAVSGSSIAGGYLGGMLVERWPGWPALFFPALLQSSVLALLASFAVPMWTIGLLALCGLCYGTAIAVVPGYIRIAFGTASFARVYARVFTAWGIAGFVGPLAAGFLYDLQGSYGVALSAAAVLSCIVAMLSRLSFPFQRGRA